MTKTIVVETPAPKTAVEAVHFAMQPFSKDDLSITTTAGLHTNNKALWAALNALAVFVDGEAGPIQHHINVPDNYVDAPTKESRRDFRSRFTDDGTLDANGNPIDRSATDTSTDESHPAGQPGLGEQAVVA